MTPKDITSPILLAAYLATHPEFMAPGQLREMANGLDIYRLLRHARAEAGKCGASGFSFRSSTDSGGSEDCVSDLCLHWPNGRCFHSSSPEEDVAACTGLPSDAVEFFRAHAADPISLLSDESFSESLSKAAPATDPIPAQASDRMLAARAFGADVLALADACEARDSLEDPHRRQAKPRRRRHA